MGSAPPEGTGPPENGTSSSNGPTEIADPANSYILSHTSDPPSTPSICVRSSLENAASPVVPTPAPRDDDPRIVFQSKALEKRVKDLEAALSALTGTPESAARVDVGEAVKYGKVVAGQIGEALRSGENRPVDAPDLKSFMDDLLGSVQRAGVETVLLAANEILRDPSSVKILRKLAERPPQPTEVADRVTEKITPLDGPGPPTLGLLVLAGALLLAAGFVLPLMMASAMAEIILTNEVAIAAVVVGVAALMKHSWTAGYAIRAAAEDH